MTSDDLRTDLRREAAVDWKKLLDDFVSADPRRECPAADAFIGVITATLQARGAYEIRSSWDDVIQEVLYRLIQHRHSVHDPAAWLRQTTIHTYIDRGRRETTRRRSVHLLDQLPWMRAQALPRVEETVAAKEELEELRRAVAKLPEALRLVVDTTYPQDPAHEVNQQCVAQQLCLKVSDVKNRLRKALLQLRREISRERNLARFRVAPDEE